MGTSAIVVLVTCPPKAAEKIAREVLEQRLAACVNTVETVRSRYWWKGKIDAVNESLLLIKTETRLFKSLERVIKSPHPYEVPEIIALSIAGGSQTYLDWISKETNATTPAQGRD